MNRADVPAVTGRAHPPRGGFGITVNLTGRVDGAPFFSRRPYDGVKAMSCKVETGATFPVRRVDGKDQSDTVYLLNENTGVLAGQVGYLDRANAAFYTEASLQNGGFLPDGRPVDGPQTEIRNIKQQYKLSTLVVPPVFRMVGYGELAFQFANMAAADTEIAVTGYGRSARPRRQGKPRRFEIVAVYVQFLRKVNWPDGGEDRFLPRVPENLPRRLAPSASIVGLVVEPPDLIPAQNGRGDFLVLVVSAGWKPGIDALATLYVVGEQAHDLAGKVRRYDLIQADCRLVAKRARGMPVARFIVRDLAILAHREV